MNYQPYLRPDFEVDPVPQPRIAARRLMLATSLAVDGPVDLHPERSDKRLVHCLYMPQASLIIVGTACRRPLLLREAARMNAAANLDVIVVRAEDNTGKATFDIKLVGEERTLCAYRMWMPRPSEAAWLVPTAVKTGSLG